jgi:hypothetical protein
MSKQLTIGAFFNKTPMKVGSCHHQKASSSRSTCMCHDLQDERFRPEGHAPFADISGDEASPVIESRHHCVMVQVCPVFAFAIQAIIPLPPRENPRYCATHSH